MLPGGHGGGGGGGGGGQMPFDGQAMVFGMKLGFSNPNPQASTPWPISPIFFGSGQAFDAFGAHVTVQEDCGEIITDWVTSRIDPSEFPQLIFTVTFL